jgi:hypothetical protein
LDLRESIFGDYSDIVVKTLALKTRTSKPKTTKTKVIKAYQVLDLAIETSEIINVGMVLLGFGPYRADARDTVFNFCLQNISLQKSAQKKSKNVDLIHAQETQSDPFSEIFLGTQKLRREVFSNSLLDTQIATFLTKVLQF